MILHPKSHSFRVAIVIAHISCIQQIFENAAKKEYRIISHWPICVGLQSSHTYMSIGDQRLSG